MSTQTDHLKLHQWEAEDDFLRSDFNEDFGKIDKGVKKVEEKIDAGVKALSQTIEAVRALALGSCAAGTITTTDAQDIDVGFAPKLVMVFGRDEYAAAYFITPVTTAYMACKFPNSASSDAVMNSIATMKLTETGFHMDKGPIYLKATAEKPAYYIAFR